ncbi:LysR family transcriptional regulator [Leisingera sp. M523]|uniref:LysR family transcriptional regulator n=1 Tax=Leisingera sp. M523 TaxID=2867013 RepID=UPI0021A398BD|nr:LysR family transcriptional regulator [Leisingera sp. M523]UWQ29731.1 LysR family transcriptional regulator [Leisingera sp. M523]
MMDLAPLRYFQSAYDTGTFSASARMNGVSQPSVSAAVSKLEEHYGGALFLRRRDGLAPTALGHELYRQSGAVLAQLSLLEQRMTGRAPQAVRVHCQPDILVASFQAALSGLRRDNAALTFQFTNSREDADILFCSDGCVPRGCTFQALWQETYGAALPRDHPLAAQAALTLADLAGEPLIARPYCPGADQLLLQEQALPAIVAEAAHDAQLLDLVAAGLGVALVPMGHARAQQGITVRPLSTDTPVQRQVGVAHRKTQFAAAIAKSLCAFWQHPADFVEKLLFDRMPIR